MTNHLNESDTQMDLPVMMAIVANITCGENMIEKFLFWRRRRRRRRRLPLMQMLCFGSLGSVALNL